MWNKTEIIAKTYIFKNKNVFYAVIKTHKFPMHIPFFNSFVKEIFLKYIYTVILYILARLWRHMRPAAQDLWPQDRVLFRYI